MRRCSSITGGGVTQGSCSKATDLLRHIHTEGERTPECLLLSFTRVFLLTLSVLFPIVQHLVFVITCHWKTVFKLLFLQFINCEGKKVMAYWCFVLENFSEPLSLSSCQFEMIIFFTPVMTSSDCCLELGRGYSRRISGAAVHWKERPG